MSERELKICRCTDWRVGWGEDTYKPATGAPSVSEVVEALREAKEWNWMDDDYPAEVEARIDNLIARLEGA